MGRLIQYRNRLLVGLLSITLFITACSGSAGVSNKEVVIAPAEQPAAANTDELRETSSDEADYVFTINVLMTDEGIQPPSIFIPAGQVVQLVLRNRGSTEHHFRVLGLRVRDLLWLAPREQTADTGEDEKTEHAHHQTSFVPFRATSPAGIKPLGDEVHAYAEAGGGDKVFFTATDTGTFLVHCPLHPEIIGEVIVY